jgi:hypothetical protein
VTSSWLNNFSLKVPTIFARLIQGYHAMDPELQAASASAARNLRLMVTYCSMHQRFFFGTNEGFFLSLERICIDLCPNFSK